jgi:H+-transporting ATPase
MFVLTSACISGSTCKEGNAEGVVFSTGVNTFFGRIASLVGQEDDTTGHLQKIMAQISSFCLIAVSVFVVVEIFVLYAGYHWSYRCGLDNILVLLTGGIPIAMPTMLSVTLAIGVKQLSSYNAIVTHITAIQRLASVTILCSDKASTLTTNKLTIDRSSIRTYTSFSADEVILLAAYASRTESQDAIDFSVIGALGDPMQAHVDIKLVDLTPFNDVDKRTEITYREEASGKLKRVTMGKADMIIELCTRNKTEEIEKRVKADVEEFTTRGLRTLAVAYKVLEGDDSEAERNGFELIGLLPIVDPPRNDSKQAIDDVLALGIKVKMVTGENITIAKEAGRRLGLGDHMYPAEVLKGGGPLPGSQSNSFDEMIMDADGFSNVLPEDKLKIVNHFQSRGHFCAITGRGANDVPALSRASVGIAIEGATDAARGAADMALTEPGLSTIVHAIRGSRIILQRMRSYAIYACAVTIQIVVCFPMLVFSYKFQFPPFMIHVISLLNDSTIMAVSADPVLPSTTPDSWFFAEIFAYAIAYGLYLMLSTYVPVMNSYCPLQSKRLSRISFVAVITESDFFQRRFHVHLNSPPGQIDHNDKQLHTIVYLQVSIISQALIFITRSHGFFLMEHPSYALVCGFCFSQLVSSMVAGFADWEFAKIGKISAGWIGVVWVWVNFFTWLVDFVHTDVVLQDIIWFIPLDMIKLGMGATVIKYLRRRHKMVRRAAIRGSAETGVPIMRMYSGDGSMHESLYSNRTTFIRRAGRKLGFRQKVVVKAEELQRIHRIQAGYTGQMLARHSPRTT